jgi:hypothetical protein
MKSAIVAASLAMASTAAARTLTVRLLSAFTLRRRGLSDPRIGHQRLLVHHLVRPLLSFIHSTGLTPSFRPAVCTQLSLAYITLYSTQIV